MDEVTLSCTEHDKGQLTRDAFGLPQAVARQLRLCAVARAEQDSEEQGVEYLWIDLRDQGLVADDRGIPPERALTVEGWLNVVDEAAALGAKCLMLCVGDAFPDPPHIWRVCRWAQGIHGMAVDIYAPRPTLDHEVLTQLSRLDAATTCVSTTHDVSATLGAVRDLGITVCVGEVQEADHSPPCSMPERMVYVGPDGRLYTCGLVRGREDYCLGSVFDRPLGEILRDGSLPRTIPKLPEGLADHNCDACPPIVAQRAWKAGLPHHHH